MTDAPLYCQAHALEHRWPGGQDSLRGVDIALTAGTISALVGANGSGKSTLLQLCAGRLRPTGGELEILGARVPGARGDRQWRSRLMHLEQESVLDPEMTGLETLQLFAVLYGVEDGLRAERVAQALSEWGLEELGNRRCASYSGGERKRLHLATGSLSGAQLLLLDEPEAGLDRDGRQLCWSFARSRAAQGAAVCIATHDFAGIEEHAQRVHVLNRGRLAFSGELGELIELHARAGEPGLLSSAVEALLGELPRTARGREGQGRRRGGGGRRG